VTAPVTSAGGGRTLQIGVVGHRLDRLTPSDLTALRRPVRDFFALMRRIRPDPPPVVVSALAEGADRLAAHEAIRAGFALRCPLPFAREEYAHDFVDPDSLADYWALLERATAVEELDGCRETPESERDAYAAVGARVLDGADVLLAVWDGEAARGDGGTGDVVQAALERRVPTVWIAATPPYRARLLVDGATTGSGEPLDRLPSLLASLPRGDG
jgi:hypothetical protein